MNNDVIEVASIEDSDFETYIREGERAALALPNRGPMRFDEEGNVHPEILAGFDEYGFYVLESVLSSVELDDWEADLQAIRENLPIHKDAQIDAAGRPALGIDSIGPCLMWAKPLGDPLGGTTFSGGRHPVKMQEHTRKAGMPEDIVYLIMGALRYSDALLRISGHPHLLAIAEAVNGEDFVPFNEAIWIKEPGLGSSTAWHQDGITHWSHPDWDQGIHGMTFQVLLYGSSGVNGLWVLPGSHKSGKVDLQALADAAGSDRLLGAVPYVCGPGDVVIHNRQLVHDAFANRSKDFRVSFTFGTHRRSSILDVEAGLHNATAVYDAARILERSRMIGYAIDARRQYFPDETPYCYKPLVGVDDVQGWSPEVKGLLRNYNLLDLSI